MHDSSADSAAIKNSALASAQPPKLVKEMSLQHFLDGAEALSGADALKNKKLRRLMYSDNFAEMEAELQLGSDSSWRDFLINELDCTANSTDSAQCDDSVTPSPLFNMLHPGVVLQARFTLRAPQAGVVTALMVREGATVAPGTPLMTLQGTATVWAEAEVPESQSAELVPGMAVSATSPAVPGRTLEGRLQALLPQVDPTTRTLKARLELANPGGRLVPGMLVQMRFARPAGDKRLLVPSDAVIRTGRRSVVMLAEADGRFRPVEVQTGREAGGQIEVIAGLQAGQRVVRSGQFLIDSEASLRGLEARLNPGSEPATPVPQSHRTDAVIDALDGDTVTLTHPPVPSLNWPEMTMDFKLPPRERQPRELGVGERVQIEFQMQDGDVPQITGIQRVAPGVPR